MRPRRRPAGDSSLLARYDASARQWHVEAGTYRVGLARAADATVPSAETAPEEQRSGT